MSALFSESQRLQMDGADVTYHPCPNLGQPADELFSALLSNIPWEQRSIRIQGRDIPQPRLVSWHGDVPYTYSGLRLMPKPWTPMLQVIRSQVEALAGCSFNSCLLNQYINERSSIGMHADDEPELGPRPIIASVSLGAERIFDMRRKDKTGRPVHINLEHGSVLIMAGDTQRNWLHGIAKTTVRSGPRINLTFRATKAR